MNKNIWQRTTRADQKLYGINLARKDTKQFPHPNRKPKIKHLTINSDQISVSDMYQAIQDSKYRNDLRLAGVEIHFKDKKVR